MYPNQYNPKFDLRKSQDDGDKLSATELYAELSNIGSSLNQAIQFIRAITTANMKIQPSQVSGTIFVIPDEQTAIAAQTDIYFQNSVTIDPLVSTVGVFINGERLPDSQVTLFTDHVVVTPALSASDNIVLEIHDNAASVFNDLISTLNGLGASLVGIEDVGGLYATSDVEDALQEVGQGLADFITAVGDLTKYLKADVAVPLEVDQDAAGYTWKNLAPAVDPNDPVILSQITSLLSILSNLAGTFLPLVGGVMQGPINMANNRITSVADPVAGGDAINKAWLDTLLAALTAAKLSLSGNKDTTANATLTGAVFMQAADDADVADADQTTDPAGVAQPTWNEVPRPATNRQVANKIYTDEAIASAVSNVQSRLGVFLERGTGTQVKGLLTIELIGTGHHRITIPAGVTTLKIGGLGGGGGGGRGTAGSPQNGTTGGKSYYTLNAGSDVDLGLGGQGGRGTTNGSTGGDGGDPGAGAGYAGAIGVDGQPGYNSGPNNLGGRGGSPGEGANGDGGAGAHEATAGFSANAQGYGAGGGGGDGATTSSGGGGGGGGGYGETYVDVVETDVIDLYEGDGGAGAGTGGDGSDGIIKVFWGE